MNGFTIKHNKDHYDIFKNGMFWSSADTYGEAERDIQTDETPQTDGK